MLARKSACSFSETRRRLGYRPFATLIGASDRARQMMQNAFFPESNGHDLAVLRVSSKVHAKLRATTPLSYPTLVQSWIISQDARVAIEKHVRRFSRLNTTYSRHKRRHTQCDADMRV